MPPGVERCAHAQRTDDSGGAGTCIHSRRKGDLLRKLRNSLQFIAQMLRGLWIGKNLELAALPGGPWEPGPIPPATSCAVVPIAA